jgi:circadian clock protein KaiC
MLEGKGYYRGSSILVSGTAGTGKSTLAASFMAAACERGERCLYFAFEESTDQIVRNMSSVGIDLARWLKSGRSRSDDAADLPRTGDAPRFRAQGHPEFEPDVVAFDPVSNMIAAGTIGDVQSMLLRLVDFLKGRTITALFTSLTHAEMNKSENSDLGISSLMDTWLLLRDIELSGERNRGIYVLKSPRHGALESDPGVLHHEQGHSLAPLLSRPNGVLTGSSRLAEEARSAAAELERLDDVRRTETAFERRRAILRTQMQPWKRNSRRKSPPCSD